MSLPWPILHIPVVHSNIVLPVTGKTPKGKKKLPNGPHNMQKTEPRGQTPSRYGLPHSRHLVPAVNLRNLCDATVEAQTGISNDLHENALKAATAKGSETTPYNLSNNTGGNTVENTANCYVVNAPGYYSLPLVYGKCDQELSHETLPHTSTVTGTNILNPFINHAGNGITDPYISGNGCTPAKAELVWHDAMNLVTDIKYNADSNGGNISFKVDRSSIRQGNAVIAIMM